MLQTLTLVVEINKYISTIDDMNMQQQPPYPPVGGDFNNIAYNQSMAAPQAGFPQPQPLQQQSYPQLPYDGNEASAPPISQLGFLPAGYEEAGYDRRPIAPPTYYAPDDDGQRVDMSAFNVPKMDEQSVRSALVNEVNSHCCWGSGAVEDIEITNIDMSSSYHYKLETFTEKRETQWTFEPYNALSHHVVPPNMGYQARPPGPWEIEIRPDEEYKDSEKKMEVPNTEIVRACHGRCNGTGRMQCQDCTGRGNVSCSDCNGTGAKHEADGNSTQCTTCKGSGRKDCSGCSSSGMKTCNLCKGFGNVRYFIELHVKVWLFDN